MRRFLSVDANLTVMKPGVLAAKFGDPPERGIDKDGERRDAEETTGDGNLKRDEEASGLASDEYVDDGASEEEAD